MDLLIKSFERFRVIAMKKLFKEFCGEWRVWYGKVTHSCTLLAEANKIIQENDMVDDVKKAIWAWAYPGKTLRHEMWKDFIKNLALIPPQAQTLFYLDREASKIERVGLAVPGVPLVPGLDAAAQQDAVDPHTASRGARHCPDEQQTRALVVFGHKLDEVIGGEARPDVLTSGSFA